MRLITSITDEGIDKLNVRDKVVSAAVSVDKLRLLRENSTENISIAANRASVSEIDQQIIELEKKLSNW